ncbi:MAG: DUF192 domain-containing protein [Phormidesmis sp.]
MHTHQLHRASRHLLAGRRRSSVSRSLKKLNRKPKQWTRRMTLLLLLGTLLIGCTDVSEPVMESSGDPNMAEAEAPDEEITLNGPGQLLEVSAIAQIKDRPFQLEVAKTPQQQALGLMFRSALPDDRGMLFPFSSPRRASFWMRDVPVPLDMVFIYQGKVVEVITAPPCTIDPCATYGPGNQIVDQVLELRGDRASEIGLQPGDTIDIQPLPSSDLK